MSACNVCGKCPCYEHERKTVMVRDPDYGDGFRMGREARDKEIEALQMELASERRAHEETRRVALLEVVEIIEQRKPPLKNNAAAHVRRSLTLIQEELRERAAARTSESTGGRGE